MLTIFTKKLHHRCLKIRLSSSVQYIGNVLVVIDLLFENFIIKVDYTYYFLIDKLYSTSIRKQDRLLNKYRESKMEVSEAKCVMSMNEHTRVFRCLESALVYNSLRRVRLPMSEEPLVELLCKIAFLKTYT